MRFSDIPESDTIKWGKELRWVLSNKISLGRPVKAEALKIGMGLEDPHEYYMTAQAVEFQRTMNEHTDMGRSTRSRWEAAKHQSVQMDPCKRT